MNKCCIIVPLYKKFSSLTVQEILALYQLYNILEKHFIIFATPYCLDLNEYIEHAKQNNCTPDIKKFDDYFFKDIEGYNQLLLSKIFYKTFAHYDFMLIYQTDAFVFRDELHYWCDKKYDYIGAPWFDSWVNCTKGSPIIGVGNGGFSLRNIKNSIRFLNNYYRAKKVWTFYQSSVVKKYISLAHLYKLLDSIIPVNYDQGIFDFVFNGTYKLNEDTIWGMLSPRFSHRFKVAPVEDALKFSFETNPEVLFKMNNNKLPFGSHAWQKWGANFWKQYINY